MHSIIDSPIHGSEGNLEDDRMIASYELNVFQRIHSIIKYVYYSKPIPRNFIIELESGVNESGGLCLWGKRSLPNME
jgi:hypothetical protein